MFSAFLTRGVRTSTASMILRFQHTTTPLAPMIIPNTTTTRIRYLSDIHIEFFANNYTKLLYLCDKIESSADKQANQKEVLILGGDIGNPIIDTYSYFLENMSQKFDKIFILPGNHEYYSSSVSEGNKKIETIVEQFENISFLNNKVEKYNGIHFVGSTLWGDLSKTDTSKYEINDVRAIKDMTAKSFQALYEENRVFLSNALDTIVNSHSEASASQTSAAQTGAAQSDGTDSKPKIVVITHHLPSYALTSNEYRTDKMEKYAGWFSGSLDDILVRHDKNIDAWVYGHTHSPSIQRIHWSSDGVGNADDRTHIAEVTESDSPGVTISECIYFCNPIGYPGERPTGKEDFDAYFEL